MAPLRVLPQTHPSPIVASCLLKTSMNILYWVQRQLPQPAARRRSQSPCSFLLLGYVSILFYIKFIIQNCPKVDHVFLGCMAANLQPGWNQRWLLVAVPTLEYSTKCAATTAAAAAKPPQPQHVSPLFFGGFGAGNFYWHHEFPALGSCQVVKLLYCLWWWILHCHCIFYPVFCWWNWWNPWDSVPSDATTSTRGADTASGFLAWPGLQNKARISWCPRESSVPDLENI